MTRAGCWVMTFVATFATVVTSDRDPVAAVMFAVLAFVWLHAAAGRSSLNDDFDRQREEVRRALESTTVGQTSTNERTRSDG